MTDAIKAAEDEVCKWWKLRKETKGSHGVCFTNRELLAHAIEELRALRGECDPDGWCSSCGGALKDGLCVR